MNRGTDQVGQVCTLRVLARSRSGLDLEASAHLLRAFWRQSAPGGRHSHVVPPPGGNLGLHGLPGDGWSDGWRRGRLHRVAGRRDAHEISTSAGRLGSSYRAGLVALCEAFACLRDRPTQDQNLLIIYICRYSCSGTMPPSSEPSWAGVFGTRSGKPGEACEPPDPNAFSPIPLRPPRGTMRRPTYCMKWSLVSRMSVQHHNSAQGD